MRTSDNEIQTIKSFDYQWTNISDGKLLLTDELWKQNVDRYILDELQVTREWIRGKSIIDVGCGGGRWTYGFAKLGCKILATDISDGPCNFTKQSVPEAEVLKGDLFELPKLIQNRKFDIVWCWGVVHHTHSPREAFDVLCKLLNPDGILHVYVYSVKRDIKIRILRRLFMPLSFKNKKSLITFLIKAGIMHGDVHQWFDILSPRINHEIGNLEIQNWFSVNGLTYNRYTPQWAEESGDIFATGRKINKTSN